ncbi:cupin domain-containing protein [Xylophilus sp.]|uniref:cupin domain-containing protein n=1 Tax=Xylophilus sp. TaxID=2653893 RepID=UPI0013BA83DE|nr:cupin domain-containing protein [Xylophilus sp.]KAF1044539.1 MAG: hypothetical protein GAK38_03477 [Xylophilus sp.]
MVADRGNGPDTLTEVLLGLRLDGVEYGRCLMHSPWAVAFPATRTARFHFVARGGCWLRTPMTDWVQLKPGDAVLLPHGSFHVLASSPEVILPLIYGHLSKRHWPARTALG